MLAYREWRVFLHRDDLRPILVSTNIATAWVEPEIAADQLPEDTVEIGQLGQLHGIHAVTEDHPRGRGSRFLRTLEDSSPSMLTTGIYAVGAVELFGRVVEHEDGVLRAERARVLAARLYLRAGVLCSRGCSPDRLCFVGVDDYDGERKGLWGTPAPPPRAPLIYLNTLCRAVISAHVDEARFWRDEECSDVAWLRARWRDLTRQPYVPLLRAREIERLLLERYEIPRLPEDAGPWARPLPEKEA
jgi:hypothetical protein